MENQEYAVFFEASNLSDVALKHIEKYFKIKRRSGGGECEISKVDENTYKMAFMEKEAQERVLKKKDHVIDVPGQEGLTVSLSTGNVGKSSKQPEASAKQKCAEDVEKVFKLDSYLLRFLSECANAESDLKARLSALHSTFKINIDSEELVVVRDPTVKEDVLPLKKWKFGVEEVCDALKSRYIIQFEFERERLKILKEYSFISGETLKIFYEDECWAFMVGEQEEINKILKFVSDMQDRQQAQKVCRLSEKRYALIKERFESHVKSNLPELKITQETADTVLIRGPEKEVHAGEKELLKLAQGIQEKRIPKHQALLTFLDSSKGIQHFQDRFQESLRSPVMLETSGSDLLLLSLSDGALEEAAAAVQRDVGWEIVHLENTQTAAAFTKLKQDLIEAVKQANRERVKVELKYQDESSSDPKVLLVGYTTEVSRLKDILEKYKRNHENYSDCLSLRMPEMVDHFPEILSMAALTNVNVYVKPTHSTSPCVYLSGPRCEVKSLKDRLESFLKSLIAKRFEVKGPGVQKFFQNKGAETLRLLSSHRVRIMAIDDKRGRDGVPQERRHSSFQSLPSAVSTPHFQDADIEINIKVVIGSLEDQQADVLVAPMIKANMTSTLIGSSLLSKAGVQLQSNFDNAKGRCALKPGNVLAVDATAALRCSKVFFVECVKGRIINNGEKALRSGLGRVFELCAQNSWESVALPIIGPGIALSIPVKDAVNILTQEICKFLRGPTGQLQTILIAIMPNYSNSEEMFQTVCGSLSAKMVDDKGQALFHSLTSDLDDIIMVVERTELHLVFGDITNETTDAIVNTTDFKDFQTSGVCKDILTKAGPQVLNQLTGAQVGSGQIFTTPPGGFPCRTIMHVCGERSPSVIKTLATEIVVQCERGRYRSVAIPAICAGQGGLDPNVVAKSILEGVKDGVQGANLQYLKDIRIILFKINVFLEFKAKAEEIFGGGTQLAAPAPLVPMRVTSRGRRGSTASSRSRSLFLPSTIDLSSLVTSLPDTKNTAAFLVIGYSSNEVSNACADLQRAFDSQCTTHSLFSDEIQSLTEEEMEHLLQTANSLDLEIEKRSSDEWVVTGLNDGVQEVVKLIQDALRRWKREKEQVDLFAKVTWCILGNRGIWQKLPIEANHKLEKNELRDGIVDAQGVRWTVDLRRTQATARDSGQLVTSLKRLENLPDFCFPTYWDNMNQSEPFKVIALDQQSGEYQAVKADFKKTVAKTVLKIERIQNINLRRLYEGHKTELESSNGPPVGAGERILYHGTSEASCSSIMHTKFDRGLAGQNATCFGNGTYFAVNASYSAQPTYAVPAADGTQLMFVVRVLTGHYALGTGGMKTPPVRIPPHHLYDSVVDNMQNPSMFVVFHDCQAYPDYLITFK